MRDPPGTHPQQGLLEDARMLLTRIGATLSHVGRMANQSADILARLGAQQNADLVVTAQVPLATREFRVLHC